MSQKIFGYDWEDIQAMQQGTYKGKPIPPGDTRPRATEKDIKMLRELGYDALKEKQFYGVLGRLRTSGYLKEGQ